MVSSMILRFNSMRAERQGSIRFSVSLTVYDDEPVVPVIKMSMLWVPNFAKSMVEKLNPDVSGSKVEIVVSVVKSHKPYIGS